MKSLKDNKTSTELHSTTPIVPISKLTSSSPARKSLKQNDATISIAKDLSLINKKLNQIINSVKSQNDVLQERVSDLESEISECRDTIMLLSTRMDAIHSMYARLEIENNSKEGLNDESTAVITVDTTIEYLKSQPIFLNAFLADNFDDQLLEMILNLESDVRSVFIEYSLLQLERITKCFEAYFDISKNTESDNFIDLISIYVSKIFSSDSVYIFQLDSKTGDYFCNFKSKHIIFSLKETDSLITTAIKSQSIVYYTNPSSEINFSPSPDLLFNSENKPILFIPVSKEATILIVHTDNSSLTFCNEDISIAKLFEKLIEPLFHHYNRYVDLNKEEMFCRILSKFKNDICDKSSFDSLLPFLSDFLSKFIKADEIRIFIHNSNDMLTSYRLLEGRLFESKHEMIGIPSFVVKNKFHLFVDFLNVIDIPSFSEETDGWASEKPFGAFPIFESKEKVSAVLCLSGKNKFGTNEFEFLMSITPLLSLIIPRCVESAKFLSAEECRKTLSQYPSIISKFTFEILSNKSAIFTILCEMQKGTKSEIISAYVSSEDNETFERLMTIKEGKVVDSDYVDSEFVKSVLNSENPINESNPSKLSLDSNIKNIMAASNKEDEKRKIIIVCINSKSSTGRFDEGYYSYLSSFSSLISNSIEIQNRNNEIQNHKKNAEILEKTFSECEEALKCPNPLLSFILSILKHVQMDNFILLRYKPLIRGYECILASEKCKRATFSEDNQFICQIKNLTKPSEIEKDSINSDNSIFELIPKFTHIVVNQIDSGLFLVCTGNKKINKNIELYFNSISPLVKSLYRNFLFSTQNVAASISEVNKIDMNSPELQEFDISSRLFSVRNLNEPQKIEIILKMFSNFDLLTIMETNIEEMTRFLLIVRDKYKKVPFHNWDHAVDCIQFAYSSIQRGRMRKYFRPHHTIAILLASLLHDIGHPGYSTTFQVKSNSPLFFAYGKESTLEKHHLSVATKILHETIITRKKMLYKDAIFWSIFSRSILSTDMVKHFEYIDKFQILKNEFNSSNEDHLLILSQLIIKCCNVGNCTRPFDVAFSMAKKLQDEYMIQAEKEKVLKLDKNENGNYMMKGNLADLEINFYDTIACPLLKILGDVVPELSDFAIQMEDNKKQWIEYRDKNGIKT